MGTWVSSLLWESKTNGSASHSATSAVISLDHCLSMNFLLLKKLYIYIYTHTYIYIYRLPWWFSGKESTCQCRRCRRHGFNPWVRKIPWRRKWQPTPVFLPGKSHGQRNLVVYNPWGHKESDMSEHIHSIFWSQNSLMPWSYILVSLAFLKTCHTDLRMSSVLRTVVKCCSKNEFCHSRSILIWEQGPFEWQCSSYL